MKSTSAFFEFHSNLPWLEDQYFKGYKKAKLLYEHFKEVKGAALCYDAFRKYFNKELKNKEEYLLALRNNTKSSEPSEEDEKKQFIAEVSLPSAKTKSSEIRLKDIDPDRIL